MKKVLKSFFSHKVKVLICKNLFAISDFQLKQRTFAVYFLAMMPEVRFLLIMKQKTFYKVFVKR